MAACATAQVYPDFLGAAGLNRVGRFMFDPRDTPDDSGIPDVAGGPTGRVEVGLVSVSFIGGVVIGIRALPAVHRASGG